MSETQGKLQYLVDENKDEFERAYFMGIPLNELTKDELKAATCVLNRLYVQLLESRASRLF